MIEIFHHQKAVASFIKDNRNFIIDYKDFDIQNSIALSLPNTQKIYLYDYKFPPFLESFLPEGYLYEIFKNLLSKEYGKVDDYLIFSLLSSNIDLFCALFSILSIFSYFLLYSFSIFVDINLF